MPSNYLVHQASSGKVLGVWRDELSYFYPPTPIGVVSKQYAKMVMDARGNSDWAEYAQRLAEKTPSPNARWDFITSSKFNLEAVYLDAVSSTRTD